MNHINVKDTWKFPVMDENDTGQADWSRKQLELIVRRLVDPTRRMHRKTRGPTVHRTSNENIVDSQRAEDDSLERAPTSDE